MPSLANIAEVLADYEGRFESLDAFVDDIDEFRSKLFLKSATLLRPAPHPLFRIPAGMHGPLLLELFADQGIARLRRTAESVPASDGDATSAVLVGGLVGSALGAASKSKEGLLGGLILGMLVGGVLGATSTSARPQPERVRALRFDPETGHWQIYDGPLLRWAKRTLDPGSP